MVDTLLVNCFYISIFINAAIHRAEQKGYFEVTLVYFKVRINQRKHSPAQYLIPMYSGINAEYMGIKYWAGECFLQLMRTLKQTRVTSKYPFCSARWIAALINIEIQKQFTRRVSTIGFAICIFQLDNLIHSPIPFLLSSFQMMIRKKGTLRTLVQLKMKRKKPNRLTDQKRLKKKKKKKKKKQQSQVTIKKKKKKNQNKTNKLKTYRPTNIPKKKKRPEKINSHYQQHSKCIS
eukprot:TRINITY_DN53248_c0_g1_i1.p1 TRINITY_DN53248_c0_g1~~TRINITY_DN53248_c0_g1_i1.p1  ORF type:complete len:234 (+),score=20.37 TRINITY_DN53248_c0_g1_i1:364-1065(+)